MSIIRYSSLEQVDLLVSSMQDDLPAVEIAKLFLKYTQELEARGIMERQVVDLTVFIDLLQQWLEA